MDGCGRSISHISPMMMHVKRVYVIRIVTKAPKLHTVGAEGKVEKEGGNGGRQIEKKERERSSDSPQRTDHHQLKKSKVV